MGSGQTIAFDPRGLRDAVRTTAGLANERPAMLLRRRDVGKSRLTPGMVSMASRG
jgi:hypothetical protein